MEDEQIRQLGKQPGTTIKFAGFLPDGQLTSDAYDAYDDLLEGLPEEWAVTPRMVTPRQDTWDHQAWVFANRRLEIEVLAVHHETGIEFLVMGLAAPLLVTGLTDLVKWVWSRWNGRRAERPDKVSSSLVIEQRVVRETFPDGRIRSEETLRWVVAPPVADAEIAKLIERAAAAGEGRVSSGVKTSSMVYVKEWNLEDGLVKTLFLPCAEVLLRSYKSLQDPRSVLDVGCGSGIVARRAAELYPHARVDAFDQLPEAIEIARESCHPAGRVKFWVDDVTTATDAQPPYDVIFAQHLLQHLYRAGVADTALRRMRSLLDPGGKLVVGVWSPDSPAYSQIYRACGEPEKIATLGMTGETMRALLSAAGFRNITIALEEADAGAPLNDLVSQYLRGSLGWLKRGDAERNRILSSSSGAASVPKIRLHVAVAEA